MNAFGLNSPTRITSRLITVAISTACLSLATLCAHADGLSELREIYGNDVILIGPIAKSSPNSRTGLVLGQPFTVTSHAEVGLTTATAGSLVVVNGHLARSGALIASQVRVIAPLSVDGATTILTTGRITKLDAQTGKFGIGNLNVDYTPSLAGGGIHGIGNGNFVQAVGVGFDSSRQINASQVVTVQPEQLEETSTQQSGPVASQKPLVFAKGGSMGSGRSTGGSMGSGSPQTGPSVTTTSPTVTAKGGNARES